MIPIQGARVAVHCGSDMDAAQRVVHEIRQRGHEAAAFRADLRDAAATRKLALDVTAELAASGGPRAYKFLRCENDSNFK